MKRKRLWINFIYFLSMLSITIVRILFAENLISSVSSYQSSNIFTILVQIGAMGILPVFCYLILLKCNKVKNPVKHMLDDFGYTKRVSGKDWLKIIVISLLSTYVIVCISSVWQTLLYYIGYNWGVSSYGSINSVKILMLELLFTATLPAIFEEFVNRGLLYSGYKNSKPKFRVVIITSLMFALMHQNITQIGYTFICGLIAGTMVYYTKSIYPAMFYHFINNAVSVLRQYGRGTGNILNYLNLFYDKVFDMAVLGIFLFIVAVIAIFILIITLEEKPEKEQAYKVLDTVIYAPKGADLSFYFNVKPVKITLLDNMFLYATIVMNAVVTVISLIFGLIL